jgi:lipopolysaccharide/colanic/teichoic acid biosynthesis glycosyltransferase
MKPSQPAVPPFWYQSAKRALDVACAALFLLLSLPAMAAVALAIRIRMGSPVVFRHARPGYREARFQCLKFRTMTDERGPDGELLSDEERLTPLGCFLRRFSLDEFPQFWNVLKGEMSLVGPRPLEIRYLPRYTSEQRRRHSVKPGITGWAQIHGRNEIDWERRLALDVWYVDHRSFWLDLRILAATVRKVLASEGVSKSGHATMTEFWGTEGEAPAAVPPRPAQPQQENCIDSRKALASHV